MDQKEYRSDDLQRGFLFAEAEAEMTSPSVVAIERSPVTANSRDNSATTSHAGQRSIAVR